MGWFTKLKTIAISRIFGLGLIAALLIGVAPVVGHAARPSAMKLFPEESVVFVRVANAHDMGERVQQTSMGRMIHDPQLQPFVENLYGKAGKLYEEEAAGKLGLTWEDLKKLPKGEIAFAVVARPDKRPALLAIIDQGDETSVADKLVDRALDLAQEKGGDFSKEKIGDVEVTVVRDKDKENRMFGVCQRENTIIAATDANLIRGLLWHWDHAGESAGASASSRLRPPNRCKRLRQLTATPRTRRKERMRNRNSTRSRSYPVARSLKTIASRQLLKAVVALKTRRRNSFSMLILSNSRTASVTATVGSAS